MARTKKPKSKLAEVNLTGEEPVFEGKISRDDLVRALNWYNYYADIKKNVKWLYDWLSESGYSKEQIDHIKKSTSTKKDQNLCTMARLFKRGVTNIELHQRFNVRIGEILDTTEDEVIEAKTEKKPAAEIPSPLIADLDDMLDSFYRSDYKSIQDPNEIINSRTPVEMARAHDYYKKILDDFLEHGEYLKGAKKTNNLKQLESILDCLQVAKTITRRRKQSSPRKKKVVPADKVVARMKYAKDSAQYNVASIDPTKILESSVLWVFRIDTRILTKYECDPGQKLSVKGASIVGYVDKKSFSIKLRKPSEVIPDVLTMPKKTLEKRIHDLSTRKTAPSPRINKNHLLVRNFK